MISINEKNELVVKPVIPVYRGGRVVKFVATVSIQEIGQVYDKLTYDEDTQRGYKVKQKGDQEVEEKIINKKNIEEMKDKVLNGFFDGGHLTWNVRVNAMNDSQQVYVYDPSDNSLVIKSQLITLPDSAQRHVALYDLSDSANMSNTLYQLPLDISLYTFEEEQSLFSEINGCGQKANKTRSLYLSNTWKTNMLRDVIEQSQLNGNVDTKFIGAARKEKLTTFSTLYDALFDRVTGAMRDVEEDQRDDITKWLIKFYNELITLRDELKPKTYDERMKVNQSSLAGSNIAFYGYAKLAAELYGNLNWKRKLKQINKLCKYGMYEGDYFSLTNPLWHGTVCYLNKRGQWMPVDSNRTRSLIKNEMVKFLRLNEYEIN